MMRLLRIWFLAATALATAVNPAWGQEGWSWRFYRVPDGLPEAACVAVTVSHGRVLIRHARENFITELDGYRARVLPASPRAFGRVYQSPGGQLWTVVPEGLDEFKDSAWALHPIPEISGAFRGGLARTIDPAPLCPLRQGVVICLLPDQLVELRCDDPERLKTTVIRAADEAGVGKFRGLALSRDGGLWISGDHGAGKLVGPARNLSAATEWQEHLLPAGLAVRGLQAPHEEPGGGLVCVAESPANHAKAVVWFDGADWRLSGLGPESILQAWRGPDDTTWAMTRETLLHGSSEQSALVNVEEVFAHQYSDVATEPGGAFWLATSEGVIRYAPLIWRSPGAVAKLDSLVHCLASDSAGRIWYVAGGVLHSLLENEHHAYLFPNLNARQLQNARALIPLKSGAVAILAGDQLSQFEPQRESFREVWSSAASRRTKVLGSLKDGTLCVLVWTGPADSPNYAWERYDGLHTEPLTDPPLPPVVSLGQPLAVFAAGNGDFWASGERGVACYHEGKWRVYGAGEAGAPRGAFSFAEEPDGKIWCATSDQVWGYDRHNWAVARYSFDRVNALVGTRDGSIWVASENGLHRYYQQAWIENGVEEGLPSTSVRQLCEDAHGRLWAGTTRGLSTYHPEADPDPPQTVVQNAQDEEPNLPEGRAVTVSFGGQDKWKYSTRSRLLYSYRLDQGDWSPFASDNSVSFPDLASGQHYLQVRSLDRNGNVDPKPAQYAFGIVPPWYKETRLVVISAAGAALALFFAGVAFNRHLRLMRSYAEVEKKVDERTRQLEMANQELFQSQKMNALGTLAAGIAHDFNNILSIVKGSAQIIEENLDKPEKIRTRLDRIRAVVEQGSGIVAAMLGFSRGSDQPAGPCEINTVVKDTVKLLGDRFLREVQIKFTPAAGLSTVAGPKDLLQQILLNLILNAAESMSNQKQILILTNQVAKPPPALALSPAAAAAYVVVSVRDSGCGIPPENLTRIFEPFFTTKALSARRGTGLGLSMVYELAKKTQVGLAVESVVNQGSTFTLILPAQNPTVRPGAQP